MKKYFLLVLLLIAISESVWSQSRLIGVMPMQFNPSFAGGAGGPRIALLTGYDYAKTDSYKLNKPLFGVSYDNFIEKLTCGVGFYASGQKDYLNVLDNNRTTLSGLKSGLILSPKFSIRGKWTIAPSLGLHYKHITFDEGDNRDPHPYDVFFLSGGILINTANFYIGYNYNFHPINESFNFKLFYEDYRYYHRPINLTEPQDKIQIGYRYQRRENSKTSYSLQANIPIIFFGKKRQHLPDASFTFRYKRLLLGASLFTDNLLFFDIHKGANITAFIGYQTNQFRIMLSTNVLYLSQHFYPELSVRWTLPHKKGSKRLNFE